MMVDGPTEATINGIAIRRRLTDGYFSANDLALALGKRVDHYLTSTATQDLLRELSRGGAALPVITARGRNGATWMCATVSEDFAQRYGKSLHLPLPSVESAMSALERAVSALEIAMSALESEASTVESAAENGRELDPRVILPTTMAHAHHREGPRVGALAAGGRRELVLPYRR